MPIEQTHIYQPHNQICLKSVSHEKHGKTDLKNNETPTKAICNKGFSGNSSILRCSKFLCRRTG